MVQYSRESFNLSVVANEARSTRTLKKLQPVSPDHEERLDPKDCIDVSVDEMCLIMIKALLS